MSTFLVKNFRNFHLLVADGEPRFYLIVLIDQFVCIIFPCEQLRFFANASLAHLHWFEFVTVKGRFTAPLGNFFPDKVVIRGNHVGTENVKCVTD